MTLLQTKACETHCRLTTATMLLRQLHRHLVDGLLVVTIESAEEGTITIHDNEAKFILGPEERCERLCVKFVIAQVQGCVDGLERLKVDSDLLLLILICEDSSTINDEPISRHAIV